jgi:hypothetical protein
VGGLRAEEAARNRHFEAESAAIRECFPETRGCKLCKDAKNMLAYPPYCSHHRHMVNIKTKEMLCKRS